jgi:hypothetical protein
MITTGSHQLIKYIKYSRVTGYFQQHCRVPESAMISGVASRGEHGNHSAHQQSGNTRAGQSTAAENIPSINSPMTEVPAGDYIDQLIRLQPNRALYLWMASDSPTEGDTTPLMTEPTTDVATVGRDETTPDRTQELREVY